MFHDLQKIHARPEPFAHESTADLWTDAHVSAQMLACHLDPVSDLSSRQAGFIERSARWIVEQFELGPGKHAADFGCGPGLYTTRLAASGAAVTGIDFSTRSIRHARDLATREGVAVEHVQADYLEFETDERFDLITMIMCDFCALGPENRHAMLVRFRHLLRPGGRLLFDVYSHRAFDERVEAVVHAPNLMDGFWASAPYFGFLDTFKYEAEKVVGDKYTIVEEAQTRTVYTWLQYFEPQALERELGEAGLAVDHLLGDVAGATFDPAAHEYAVIARPAV